MRSSTFSSDRIKSGATDWATWLVAILLACGLIATHSGLWQHLGATPFPVDGKALWAKERAEASDSKLVLAGMSRLLFALDESELRALTSQDNIAQLAVPGLGPLPTLTNLAADPSFHGTILLSFFPTAFLPPIGDGQQSYVDYYRQKWNTNQAVNRRIGQWIEEHLVSRQPNYSITNTLRSVINSGRWPTGELYLSNDENRTYYADYEKADIADQQNRRIYAQGLANDVAKNLGDDAWHAMTAVLAQATQAITDRGGCVIIVRMPVGELISDIESSAFPRAQYWDPMIETLATPAVHYADFPALQTFEWPDFVHADQRDKALFTRTLIEQVRDTLSEFPNCTI